MAPSRSVPGKAGPGRALTRHYFAHYEFLTQFQGAERIAEQWQLTREELDRFGEEKFRMTLNELLEEQDAVKELLPS